jgi:hypothetical protein
LLMISVKKHSLVLVSVIVIFHWNMRVRLLFQVEFIKTDAASVVF